MSIPYRAILLKKIKYGERNLILQTYTRQEGSKSFFAGAQNSKGKLKTPLHPLSILEIETTRGKGSLLRIKEMTNQTPFLNIREDFRKTSILMFLNEVLMRCLGEYQEDHDLFDFIERTCRELDSTPGEINNFHIKSLFKLSSYLGFYPNGHYSAEQPYFDLIEGIFSTATPLHSNYISSDQAPLFSRFLENQESDAGKISLSNKERRELLNQLLIYYRIHIENFNELKSVEVLETVLS
jgi:DNA repair protein RecO (recombination protein O)